MSKPNVSPSPTLLFHITNVGYTLNIYATMREQGKKNRGSMEGLDAWDRLIFGTEYERSQESIIAGDDFREVIEL